MGDTGNHHFYDFGNYGRVFSLEAPGHSKESKKQTQTKHVLILFLDMQGLEFVILWEAACESTTDISIGINIYKYIYIYIYIWSLWHLLFLIFVKSGPQIPNRPQPEFHSF